VLIVPSNPMNPSPPPYHALFEFSFSSTKAIARVLGAPVTVTAQVWASSASKPSNPSRSTPTTWSTVWMTCSNEINGMEWNEFVRVRFGNYLGCGRGSLTFEYNSMELLDSS